MHYPTVTVTDLRTGAKHWTVARRTDAEAEECAIAARAAIYALHPRSTDRYIIAVEYR